jgi:rod shape determining protein RodA
MMGGMQKKYVLAILIILFGALSSLLLSSIAPKEVTGQIIFVIAGICLFTVIQYPTSRFYTRTIGVMYGVTLLGLLITLGLGKISHGAMRWLPVGPIHVQMSEVAKPILALALSIYVTRYPLSTQKRLSVFALLSALYIGPVFVQPDLGSALVLSVIAASIAFLSVEKLHLLLPWLMLVIVGGAFLWQFVLYPYQKERLLSFSADDSSPTSYNSRQALITVGSGKLFGRGLGHGVQSTLRFLPEYHTDFFFASFAEEMGLLGVLVIFSLYGILFWTLGSFLSHAPPQAKMYSIALLCALFFQAAVHVGMNMRLFPITGIPLPLLSSGGSSFVSICIGLGLASKLLNT